MSDYYTCRECGANVGSHDDNHGMYCPGSTGDRLDRLESDFEALQAVARGAFRMRKLWIVERGIKPGCLVDYVGESEKRAHEIAGRLGAVAEPWLCAVRFESGAAIDVVRIVMCASIIGSVKDIAPPDV